MVNKAQIRSLFFANFNTTKDFEVDDDGVVNCEGSAVMRTELDYIPVKFGRVDGHFSVGQKKLKSLHNSPHTVGLRFDVSRNYLLSLAGGPIRVGGTYDCSHNHLETLEGSPRVIHHDFLCYKNNLKTLTYAPQTVEGEFDCSYNLLETLQGGPTTVDKSFSCNVNYLKDLIGMASHIGRDVDCSFNNLESLKGLPDHITGILHLPYNSNLPLLRSLAAGGILFNSFAYHREVGKKIEEILGKFAGQGRKGVIACTTALMKLQTELKQTNPDFDISRNIKW